MVNKFFKKNYFEKDIFGYKFLLLKKSILNLNILLLMLISFLLYVGYYCLKMVNII